MGRPEDYLSPDDHRENFKEKLNLKVVTLEGELDRMIKLVALQRETIEKTLLGGFAYKQDFVDEKGIRALKDLTAAYNSLTDSKVRLEKTAKDRAARMTPEEEKEAVATYVKALPHLERAAFIKRLVKYHNRHIAAGTKMTFEGADQEPDDGEY